MVAFFCVGLGEFLTFAAMVLGILVNMGQISQNIVARNIYITSLDTTGFETALRTNANNQNVNVDDIFAANQAAPELAGNGVKNEYKWGLYSFCAGAENFKTIACSSRNFGYKYQPLNVLQADISSQYRSFVSETVSASTFQDSSYLARFSNAANYIIFVATVVIGVSFLIAFLAHRFAFLMGALLALAGAALFFVGAAIWTAIIYKVRHSLADQQNTSGLDANYGNALWMTWAAGGASVLAVIPLLISCISGRRSKY
ncbi:uncharacterized protein FA14DRAFT_192121 [Meira miltonrushii]|uniref:SUR7-domain-containing protein n=1 Tax=Meira miltonrushii TaxID=1280837 RepID=A0A316V6A3_9BASI|nr:uncharacterized protein FA14DRAFT_192121 [Meira miltonrushii]PWN33090.1 hypothetical protein FA14DRAFT_192121 [Meira miltonrushii]